MTLQGASYTAIDSCRAALANAILFSDAPSSMLLSAIEDPAYTRSSAAAGAPLRGVDYLVQRMGVRNCIAMDETIAEMDKEDAMGPAPNPAVTAPTTVTAAPATASDPTSPAADSGWNNDLDFADVDDPADEQQSTPASAASTAVAPSSTPRCITILPLDLSHASIDDPDVLALIDSAKEDATAAASASAAPAAAASKPAAKSDEWGWNDDGDEGEAAVEKAAAVPTKLTASKQTSAASTSKPGPPVRATSKACVWISGALSSASLARVAKLVARTRCGPAAFTSPPQTSSSPEVLAWDDVHLLTNVSENAHVEDPAIGQSFAALEAQLVSLVQAERKKAGASASSNHGASKPLKVSIHFAPLAITPLSASTFLAPVALPATSASAARVTTVPPALHMPSDASLSALLASAATSVVGAATAAPTTATTASSSSSSSAPASSPTSLLGGFSVSSAFSNISKGLSEHIREAEAIAMQGADPNVVTAAGTQGAAGAAAASSLAASPSSLSAPLSCSLANLLLSLRVQPDFFALGPSTSELASFTLSQLRSLKQQSLVAETLELEAATEALRLHKKKHGQRSGAPPAPVISAALPAWTTGSVLLVDRSLDLLSVAMHHSPAESMRDRLHDASEANAPQQGDQESKQQPVLTQAEMIERMLATELDATGAPDFSDHFPVEVDAIRDAWFGPPSGVSSDLDARHAMHANFPAAPVTAEARSLLQALDSLSSESGASSGLVGSTSAASKSVLVLLRKHLSKLVSSCGLAPPESIGAGAGSVAQLGQECSRLLACVEEHRELRFRHREMLQLCGAILRSCCRLTPSLYDRLLSFEQLLLVQLLSNTATSAGSSNNSNEDESARALRGLTQLVLDFVSDATATAGGGGGGVSSSKSAGKSSKKEAGAAIGAGGDRISIQDTLRLLLFFFSITGGRHFVPEQESKQLEAALRSVIASAPAAQRRWVAEVCGLDSESGLLSEDATSKLVAGFFEQLRAVSVARSGLSASDLIDLCSPLESASADDTSVSAGHEGGGFQPFLVRLLSRVFDPASLVDDLESMPFGEDDTATSTAKTDEEGEGQSSAAAGRAGGQAKSKDKKRDASSALDSMTSDSGSGSSSSPAAAAAAAASSGSGWSFLGSLASSVVSSVTSTASSLGFRHSTLRPGMAAGPLLIFVVGGATHGEIRRLQRMGEAWAKRVHAEEAGAAREARMPPPSLRSVIVGASQIATAQETVQALLHSAAKDLRAAASRTSAA